MAFLTYNSAVQLLALNPTVLNTDIHQTSRKTKKNKEKDQGPSRKSTAAVPQSATRWQEKPACG